jgi:hypothetical protein
LTALDRGPTRLERALSLRLSRLSLDPALAGIVNAFRKNERSPFCGLVRNRDALPLAVNDCEDAGFALERLQLPSLVFLAITLGQIDRCTLILTLRGKAQAASGEVRTALRAERLIGCRRAVGDLQIRARLILRAGNVHAPALLLIRKHGLEAHIRRLTLLTLLTLLLLWFSTCRESHQSEHCRDNDHLRPLPDCSSLFSSCSAYLGMENRLMVWLENLVHDDLPVDSADYPRDQPISFFAGSR